MSYTYDPTVHGTPLVTVYTCVYNGEKTLHRVFGSMKKLTYPNIEHVIVNDGSTDNTEALIKEYIKEVSFPVKYHKKENGGKHTALNVVWDISSGKFMLQLDADDELFPSSIECLLSEYFNIPEDKRDEYWTIDARCVTQDGKFVGEPYPEGINDLDWEEAKAVASNTPGEKISLREREKFVHCKFPEVVGAKFLPESMIWKQINLKYRSRYINDVVRVYYVNEGGSLTSKHKNRKHYNAFTYHYKWKVMHPEIYPKSFKDIVLYSLGYFVSEQIYRKHNRYLDEITDKKIRVILSLLYPFSFVGALVARAIKGIK